MPISDSGTEGSHLSYRIVSYTHNLSHLEGVSLVSITEPMQ